MVLAEWVSHLRYAIEDLEAIEWDTMHADNSTFFVLRHSDGRRYPSWLLSDGTLRLLGLTALALLGEGFNSTYLVEEPENGVNPRRWKRSCPHYRPYPRDKCSLQPIHHWWFSRLDWNRCCVSRDKWTASGY